MNDPHVKALLYRLEHSPFIIYANAPPCECDLPEFRVRVEGDQATVELKAHFATAEEARKVVDPFLRAWGIDAALALDDPEALRFVHQRADIIDRAPSPGTLAPAYTEAVGHVSMGAVIAKYPRPLSGAAHELHC